MKKRVVTFAAAFAAIFVFSFWAAPAAFADSEDSLIGCGPIQLSRCGYGGVNQSNTHVYACDTYADGYGFQTTWWLANGNTGSVSDPNGSSSGCGESTPGSASNRVTSYQVCSKRSGYNFCKPRVFI